MRAFIIVLDSVGIGEAPDAADYGDAGSNTLAHTAEAVGGLNLPTLQSYGLGNIPALTGGLPIKGVVPTDTPLAGYGAMQEVSEGKDTTTGHWEIAGLHLKKGLHLFPAGPPSFPPELLKTFEERTGRKTIGDKAASGTAIINELGEQQMQSGDWIVYTSADSVMQIAAHEDIIPLKELYDACRIARELCNEYAVGRVIARPYIGVPGSFTRTENRRDFSYPLPEPSILSILSEKGFEVKRVIPETIAEKQGIKRGDVILSIDGNDFVKMADLKKYLSFKNWKDSIKFQILRKEKEVEIEFVIEPEE